MKLQKSYLCSISWFLSWVSDAFKSDKRFDLIWVELENRFILHTKFGVGDKLEHWPCSFMWDFCRSLPYYPVGLLTYNFFILLIYFPFPYPILQAYSWITIFLIFWFSISSPCSSCGLPTCNFLTLLTLNVITVFSERAPNFLFPLLVDLQLSHPVRQASSWTQNQN